MFVELHCGFDYKDVGDIPLLARLRVASCWALMMSPRPVRTTSSFAGLLLLAGAVAACQVPAGSKGPTSVASESKASAVTLTGFTDSIVFSGHTKPVAVRFATNGRVFVLEKGGRIFLYDNLSDTTPTLFVDFSAQVNSYWDRGLSGMALHPNYPNTPHIYLLYTHDTATNAENNTSIAGRNGSDTCPTPPGGTDHGCVTAGVLSRLVDTGSYPLTGANETVLVTEWPQQYPGHSVQHLAFGPDGYLYASAGDGALHNVIDTGAKGIPVNPTNDPAGSGGALRVQSLRRPNGEDVVMNGAVIRIDPTTGAAAPDNPNLGHVDPEAQRIVAFGLRNPFRFTFHPGSGEIWVGDVGAKLYDEINHFSIAAPVENFGWPCYEGPGRQGGYDSADLPFCESLYGTTEHAPPFFNVGFAQAVFPNDTCSTAGGTAISGLAFYPTAGGNYPSNYQGAFFFSDYARGCIWVMSPGAGGDPVASSVATFVTGATNIVDLQVGPGGDLFYVSHSGGAVRRIRYQTPSAVATANPSAGAAPLTVQFDGSASSKVSATDTLVYDWDLDGDGQYDDATGVAPTFVYVAPGTYNARLRVTDQLGRMGFSSIVAVTAGNPPEAFIDTPAAGATWVVDQAITFSGHATDPDQGPLPSSALAWELVLEHCPDECHSHSVQSWTGVANGSFPAPDHEYPTFLNLVMRATDASGITTTVTRRLDPRTVTLTFDSAPVTTPRLSLGFNFESLPTPFSRTVIVGSTVSVSAAAQSVGGTNHTFGSWSDGGAANHSIVAPTTPRTYTATFASSPWTNADVGAVAAAGSFSEGSGGAMTVGGSGADIWGTADEFHFVYKQLVGDGTITARVTSVQNVNGWTKAGVMMRESTAAGARNVAAVVSPTPGNRYRRQSRATVNTASTGTGAGTGAVPVYLRVSRTGNVFTSWYSENGSTFSQIGAAQTVAMSATILVGLAVTSHTDGTVATAGFDSVTVTTPAPATLPPAPTGLAATAGNAQVALSWTAPTAGATSYAVKWSNTPGGPYTSIGGITNTNFNHTGLSNGLTYYYVVAASNGAGEGPPGAEIAATPTAPAFLTQDVGAVAASGSWSQAGGVHTVRGSGADMYRNADEFRFVYRSLTGDGTITARVVSLENVNAWTKAGVMMRENLTAGARNVAAIVSPTPSNAYRLQARAAAAGSTTSIAGGSGAIPVYLRIKRVGNVFTASFSNSGSAFTQIGTPQTITMGTTIQVGLAVTSHVDGTLATGVFDNLSLTTP